MEGIWSIKSCLGDALVTLFRKLGPLQLYSMVGLLYSVTSLPLVIVGTLDVYITGQLLDMTHQDWSYVFGLNAFVNVLGATEFDAWYDSKQEFQ
jgi:hypothetical protein